jgi:O-antigen ligase
MIVAIRKHYWSWGWLLPAWLPLLQIVGRGAFNVVGVIALAWAAIGLYGTRVRIDGRLLLLYGLMLLAFLLSLTVAIDTMTAWHRWLDYFLYSLFTLIMLASLSSVPNGIHRFLSTLGWSGVFMIMMLSIWLLFQVRHPGFTPETVMREDNLPLITPFVLYALQYDFESPHWRRIALVTLVAIFAYVIGSNGRAALVGLCVALLAYSKLVWNVKLRYTGTASVLAVVAALFLHGGVFDHGAGAKLSVTETLDQLSTYRTAMWRHVLEHPPANKWLGVGMGNTDLHPEILAATLPNGVKIEVGKHLHNFVFDCWYATGALGLGSLLLWLVFLIWRGMGNWMKTSGDSRVAAGTLMAASIGIIANASLSYSYGSKQFALYLFMFLAAAAYLPSRTPEKAAVPPRT